MLRYNFLSEPAAFVVYRSQPPMTLQSGVVKFKALVTSSKSRSGKNFIFAVLEGYPEPRFVLINAIRMM